jgi:osmotically-inducible protein OsmY
MSDIAVSLPSDESLRAAILSRFATAARRELLQLRVGVLNGIAHLAGSVPSMEIYQLAAEIAGSVPGIRGVANRIEAPGAPDPSRRIDLHL